MVQIYVLLAVWRRNPARHCCFTESLLVAMEASEAPMHLPGHFGTIERNFTGIAIVIIDTN
jgi:hypothetical protein